MVRPFPRWLKAAAASRTRTDGTGNRRSRVLEVHGRTTAAVSGASPPNAAQQKRASPGHAPRSRPFSPRSSRAPNKAKRPVSITGNRPRNTVVVWNCSPHRHFQYTITEAGCQMAWWTFPALRCAGLVATARPRGADTLGAAGTVARRRLARRARKYKGLRHLPKPFHGLVGATVQSSNRRATAACQSLPRSSNCRSLILSARRECGGSPAEFGSDIAGWGTVWGHVGLTSGSFWGQIGVIGGHFGVTLGSWLQ